MACFHATATCGLRRGDRFRAVRIARRQVRSDRKSTRLNSSHTVISYAVFCLKKKIIHLDKATSLRVVPRFTPLGISAPRSPTAVPQLRIPREPGVIPHSCTALPPPLHDPSPP